MLTLAANAAAIIRRLTSRVDTDTGGLRIVSAERNDVLAFEVATSPLNDETVLESDGARVFLGTDTAEQTMHMELYAFAQEGSVHLAMRSHG